MREFAPGKYSEYPKLIMKLEVVILAAGQGTRMKSRLPKVLHEVAGKPLLEHVVRTAQGLNPAAIHVVIGHGAEQVEAALEVPCPACSPSPCRRVAWIPSP